MREEFQSLIESLPIITSLIDGDYAISITSKTECIYNIEGKKVKPPLDVGIIEDVQALKGLDNAIKSRKVLNQVLTKEVEGKDLRITIIPIYNKEDKVIGTFGVARSTEDIVEIKNASHELMSSLQETSSSVSEVANNALIFSKEIKNAIDKTKEATVSIEESSNTIELIKNISKQSKLLGLNASIESARAGENGKGFAVVASEIKKLAEISSTSSQKISQTLFDMNRKIEEISTLIKYLGEKTIDQADIAENLAMTIGSIAKSSEVLVNNLESKIVL